MLRFAELVLVLLLLLIVVCDLGGASKCMSFIFLPSIFVAVVILPLLLITEMVTAIVYYYRSRSVDVGGLAWLIVMLAIWVVYLWWYKDSFL